MKMRTETGFTCIPPSELQRRVDTIPLPKNLKNRFTMKIISWQLHSGTEWTVVRLKSLRDCLMQSYASGGKNIIHKPEWFATTPSGRLHGVFGDLFTLGMKSSGEFQAVLHLINIYTAFSRTEVPEHLLSDIESEITQKPAPNHKINCGYDLVGRPIQPITRFKALRVRSLNPRPTIPLTMVLPGKDSHSNTLDEDIMSLAGSPLYTDPVCKRLLDSALGSEITMLSAKTSTVVGRVGITCEPGLKLRYFAAPNQLVQRALEPLKDELLLSLQSFPWDCTLDQRKADVVISNRLAQGGVIHSVDLSKATDNFPWHWQHLILKWFSRFHSRDHNRVSDLVHLMHLVVTSGWWVLPNGSRVKWGKGQPLGLGPSFPLFTMSHGLLLYFLNGGKWNKDFYVLGDDVVILNDALNTHYREVLSAWGVSISEAKSFSSCNIAQFGGVTYTQTGSFWLPKWVPFTRDNLLDLAAWWYKGLTDGLPDSDLINRVLSIPAPYGIGRNPEGLPLDARFTPEMVLGLLDRLQRRDERAKPSSTRVDIHTLISALNTLDQGSKYALERMLSDTKVIDPRMEHPGPTGPDLPEPLLVLMHQTEAKGYPYLRRSSKNRVDPYSLGSLKSWKQLFKTVDKLAQNPS